jgi:hypothetical protein
VAGVVAAGIVTERHSKSERVCDGKLDYERAVCSNVQTHPSIVFTEVLACKTRDTKQHMVRNQTHWIVSCGNCITPIRQESKKCSKKRSTAPK